MSDRILGQAFTGDLCAMCGILLSEDAFDCEDRPWDNDDVRRAPDGKYYVVYDDDRHGLICVACGDGLEEEEEK